MLFFQHFKIDTRSPKCCFSSTMKHDLIRLLAGILAITGLFSCSSQGPQYGASPSAGSDAIRESAPSERPGLATGWGNERTSPVTDRPFVRASSKPAGTDAVYYNDAAGIQAMAGERERVQPMQTAAGGMVEWGIKGKSGFLTTYKEGYSGLLTNSYFGRRLVAGEKNSTYSIFIKNRSKSTLEIVASVDGLDVKDGKPASFSKRGYLIDPGKSLEIDGFRTSYDSVAEFKFSSVSNSYANQRHGDTRNVGVIGIAVFTQKGVDPWTWMPREVQTRDSAQPFAAAPKANY